jgi:hypothetical protein
VPLLLNLVSLFFALQQTRSYQEEEKENDDDASGNHSSGNTKAFIPWVKLTSPCQFSI